MTASEPDVQAIALTEIAERYGTPCYVYDADVLSDRVRSLRRALTSRLEIFFSLKANPNVSVCAVLHQAGACAEVSSAAELHTALLAGVRAEDIVFLGPGKSEAEILACLRAGIYAIIAESIEELAIIDRLAAAAGCRPDVALRVNPNFVAKGSGLTMGGKARQFGIDETQLLAEAPLPPRFANLRLIGVQAYLGTRILSEAAIISNTGRIFALAERIADRHGFELLLVDVGGGLGVAYFEGEQDLDLGVLGTGMRPIIQDFRGRHPGTRTIMEAGRYLCADAGRYLARVRYTKISHGENFAVLDGGTNHHMAAVGIGSFVRRNFPIQLVGAGAAPADTLPWTLTGPLCTPNDVLAMDVALPPVHVGDLITVLRSGAYGPSASPGAFLSHGYPAEVMVIDGTAQLIRSADSLQDIIGRQHLIEPPIGKLAAAGASTDKSQRASAAEPAAAPAPIATSGTTADTVFIEMGLLT